MGQSVNGWNDRDPMRRIIRTLGIFFICSAAVPIAVTVVVLASFLFLPLPAALPEPRAGIESRISHIYAIDRNGSPLEIGIFRKFEQKIDVRREDIPLVMKQAIISSEDRNFYKHGGVDLRGSARALWADMRNKGVVQGGSTLTQQYVKNAYTNKQRTVTRKIREAILASQLDRQFDKDEILFRYLSDVYLGEGAYGVGAASETYFRKPVSQLTLSEAAMLAGVVPAPSFYEPRGNPAGAETKRKLVLGLMLAQGHIDQAQHDQAVAQPVWLASQGKPPGPVTLVYPPLQQQTQFPYFVDYVKRYLYARYGPDKVDRGGLQIQTTLDPDMQREAEASVANALKGTQPPLEMALASVEPPTGYVKALVGGRDFYNGSYAQVNLALGFCPPKARYPEPKYKIEVAPTCWSDPTALTQGGGSGRQPGSSWKPFVLAAAFQKGIPPTKTYSAPGTFTAKCNPPKPVQNYEGGAYGHADLRTGTWKSINTVYAQLIKDVGDEPTMESGYRATAEMAKKLGVTSAFYSPTAHGNCNGNFALGTLSISPLEQAAAFGVFAARGLRAPPTPVLKVVDAQGKVLEDNTKPEQKRVLEEIVADNVTGVLRGVITSGTGTRANIGRPAAGKTGTAQEWRDGWFVGYTPVLSTAIWMGYADAERTVTLGKCGGHCAGGTLPAATWKTFMDQALQGVPATDFSQAAPIKPIADALQRQKRGGIDLGSRRAIQDTPEGGPYQEIPGAPRAYAPPTTASTEPPFFDPGTTTTTRRSGTFP
ncbi:MAG: penicillin-binding protein [Actinomycetota bacterium]|nr:penicillin-binding protein [Actinomycetota bacterium]